MFTRLDAVPPLVVRETFPNWFAVVPGGCWLSLGEISCKEGSEPKTSQQIAMVACMFVCKHSISRAVVKLENVQGDLEVEKDNLQSKICASELVNVLKSTAFTLTS